MNYKRIQFDLQKNDFKKLESIAKKNGFTYRNNEKKANIKKFVEHIIECYLIDNKESD